MIDWTPTAAVLITIAIATVTDVRTLKVHNLLTLPVILAGFIYHFQVNGSDGLQICLLNVCVVVGVLFIPYLLGAIGAGDVKLMAALGAWLGTSATFRIAAIALFATGAYSLILLVRQHRLSDAWLHFKLSMLRIQMMARHLGGDGALSVHELSKTPEGRARLVPFSAMLALGTLVALGWHIWFP